MAYLQAGGAPRVANVTVAGNTTALPVNCSAVMPRCGSLENVISTDEAGFVMNWARPAKSGSPTWVTTSESCTLGGQDEAAQPRIVEALAGLRQPALGDRVGRLAGDRGRALGGDHGRRAIGGLDRCPLVAVGLRRIGERHVGRNAILGRERADAGGDSRLAAAAAVRRALDTLSALVSATGVRIAAASAGLSQSPRMLMMSFGDSEASWIGAARAGPGRGAGRLSAEAT